MSRQRPSRLYAPQACFFLSDQRQIVHVGIDKEVQL